jgi:hypothetical protein
LFGIQARGLDFKMNAGAGKVLFSCASSACREKSASKLESFARKLLYMVFWAC